VGDVVREAVGEVVKEAVGEVVRQARSARRRMRQAR
jgi:hypothetical protein